MTETKPKQIQAIELAKGLFEFIQGNMGLLRFSVDVVEPVNGHGTESDKWKVVCSFYETLSSQSPTVYETEVNLIDRSVKANKMGKEGKVIETKNYKFVEDSEV